MNRREMGLCVAGTVAAGMAYVVGKGDAVAAMMDDVQQARLAGEDYGYEAGTQEAADRYNDGYLAGYEHAIANMMSCQEDEVWIDAVPACVPMDDADFTQAEGWVTK